MGIFYNSRHSSDNWWLAKNFTDSCPPIPDANRTLKIYKWLKEGSKDCKQGKVRVNQCTWRIQGMKKKRKFRQWRAKS